MQSGGGGYYGALVSGEDALVVLGIGRLGLARDVVGERGLAQVVQGFLELIVRPVIEEAECTSPGCGVVYHLCDHTVVVTEIELVADTYLAGRLYKDIPEFIVGVEFAQQEHLDAGACLFLVAV